MARRTLAGTTAPESKRRENIARPPRLRRWLHRCLIAFAVLGVGTLICTSGGATEKEPHVRIGQLEVVFARTVTNDARAIKPAVVFDEPISSFYMAFRNTGGSTKRVSVDVYAEDVDGILPDSTVWRDVDLSIRSHARQAMRLDGPSEGLPPGRYRFEFKADGHRRTATVEVAPRQPFASREGEINLASGYNIALAALGGRLQHVSQWDDQRWSAEHLNDGITWVRSLEDSNDCINCGWSSKEGDRRPEIVISFASERQAALAAVVIDTTQFTDNAQSDEQIVGGLPKVVSILVSNESAAGPYEMVAEARLRLELGRQIIPLREGTRGRFVKVAVKQNFGAAYVVMAEVEVIEANSEERSVVDGTAINLANPALGGTVVRYTGFWQDRAAAYLFDGIDANTSWESYDDYFPQDFTLAFKNDQPALIDSIRLTLSAEDAPAAWPSEVAISLSHTSPLDGFVEVGRFRVQKQAGSQVFPVARQARYAKVRILDNYGAERTALAELTIIEGQRDDYISVLARDKEPTEESVSALEFAEDEPGTVTEVEPNEGPSSAGTLPVNATLRGRIDPLGEHDFFALPPQQADASALTLVYRGRPHIRHGLSLLDADGGVISHFDPGDLPAEEAHLTFALSGNESFLELTEPAATVVVIWDTSGSMQGSERDLERAVREYIRRAPPNQSMNLIRFSDKVEVVLPEFTSQKPELLRALRGKFEPSGGTRLYDAVLTGIELLRDVEGNRAVVVMTDGEDNGRTWHGDFWGEIETHRVRLYTIGLGRGLDHHSHAFATTGKRVLAHLASGTDGDSFFAVESEALRQFYAGIADELSRPATYLLTPTLEQGQGRLRLIATAEQIPSAAMPAIHVIFDVSGSMSERLPDGRRRIQAAKEAFVDTVQNLPDGVPFGLTVYGARLPENRGKDVACEDILTAQDLAPLRKESVIEFVEDLRPRGGTTPLARSITQVANNFRGENGGIIVAITDGIEECDSQPLSTMQNLMSKGLIKIQLNVIGFALADESAKGMMERIARIGGGDFYDAADGEAVAAALKSAMSATFEASDATGRVVARGKIDGDPVQLPAGFFQVDVTAADGPIRTREVRIDKDLMTTLRVNKVGSEIDVSVGKPHLFDTRTACGTEAMKRNESERTRRIQEKLNELGIEAGHADGIAGARTRRAISEFQRRYELPRSTQLTLRLEQHLDCVLAVGDTFHP